MRVENNVLIKVYDEDIKNGGCVIPDGITIIGSWAFCGCESLTNIIIPDGVINIKDYAFCKCSSLKSIVIPNSVQNIGNWAFSYCSSLKSIVIPNGVTNIGHSSFFGCESLININIPDGVTNIKDYTFCKCSSLKSIVIPNGVTRICNYAFSNCTSLKSKTNNYKAVDLQNGKLLAYDDFEYTIGKWTPQLTDIEVCEHGYHYCTNLFDVFNYYAGEFNKNIAIFECEVGNEVVCHKVDSKKCANTIKLTKRLYKNDIIKLLNV